MNSIRGTLALTLILAARAQGAGESFTITDHGYRNWPPALLHYHLAGHRDGPVALLDKEGKAIPAQVNGGQLLFVAGLASSNTVSFTLGKGKPATSTLKVNSSRARVEVSNEFFALQLPPVGQRKFKPGQAAPGPFAAWKPAGGLWMGASRFVTTRPIVAMESKILKNGPAVFEYEARYRFEPKGEYVCRVQVCPGIDYAGVVEEYDFGQQTDGHDFLMLDMEKQFTPATIGWFPIQAKDVIQRQPFAAYIAERTKANDNPPVPVGGQGVTPMPPLPEPGMVLLDKITPSGRWGDLKGGLELRAAATDTNAPPTQRVAIVTMHSGNWRRTLAWTVWQQAGRGLTVALPISTRPARWYSEVADDISPFSTHEHDPSLPESQGRREWALYFGANPEQLQSTAGHIGLDAYKDWVLDWPNTAPATEFPRAQFTKAQVARLKKTLAQHPDREALEKWYVFSGKTEDAVYRATQAISSLKERFHEMNEWTTSGLSHYRQAQYFPPVTSIAEDALACPSLPADLRRELLRTLAVGAYLIANPDVTPRGAGVHLGNNNMSIGRTLALSLFAGLLTDHPRYGYWMEQTTAVLRFKLGTYFAVDGTAIEPPTYQLYGPLRGFDDAITIVRNTGGPDLAGYEAANLQYLANLTVPDARWDGRRIFPGMGNSANMLPSIFGITLVNTERVDPSLAARLKEIHLRCWPTEPLGRLPYNRGSFALNFLPDLTPTNAALTTRVIPTYGVVFRAHYGSPDETAMLFRIGANWGHWDTDPLNVILYGQGAPLSPGTGYQYYSGPASANNAIYHNQVKVGRPDLPELFGRVDNDVLDYGFETDADYAVGARYYPPEIFTDNGGELSSHRHVLFLKSPQPTGPNYFVLRDTVVSAKPRPTWWTWLNLEGADRISVDGVAFRAADAPVNNPIALEKLPSKRGQVVEMRTDFGAQTWFWFDQERVFRPRLTFQVDVRSSSRLGLPEEKFPRLPTKETKTILEGIGEPGQDWFYVVYPRKDDRPAPTVTKLAEGCLKIVTTESTDYVFVSDQPLAFDQDGVVFNGKAGAVRIFKDRVALCLNAGAGRVGYKGRVFSGPGSFERVVALSDVKAGETNVTDTYEKKRQTLDLGDGVQVSGEAPFTAKLDGHVIRIHTEGRARLLFVTKPAWLRWVAQTVDGTPWMADWSDYPGSGWGAYKNTFLIAVTVPDGKHDIELKDLVFPSVWSRQFELHTTTKTR